MLVKDHYRCIIREIMAECGIDSPSWSPNYVINQDATFSRVVQYTHWYVDKGDSQEHYRYCRYLRILRYLTHSERRIAHVDIGCGAGVFSWAFVDWATEKGIGYDRVGLYGFDHSQAMIQLAGTVRDKLTQHISRYPELRYSHDIDALLYELKGNHRKRMDYTITFGHVLAQAHTPSNIQRFVQIIVYIRNKLMDAKSECHLAAVDSHSGYIAFAEGWDSLLENLERAGIKSDPPIMISNSARLTRIYPA